MRDGLYRALRQAFSKAGIPWKKCHHEDRGDGVWTLGDKVGQASALESLGDTSLHHGHPGHAVANYQRAVALRRELGDHYLEAVALTRLGDIHHSNDNAAAAEAWHQALAILDELAHPDAAKVRAKLMDSVANCD